MSKIENLDSVKLEQLRQDIREGLANGTPTLWDPEEIKREGRMRRAARLIAEPKS